MLSSFITESCVAPRCFCISWLGITISDCWDSWKIASATCWHCSSAAAISSWLGEMTSEEETLKAARRFSLDCASAALNSSIVTNFSPGSHGWRVSANSPQPGNANANVTFHCHSIPKVTFAFPGLRAVCLNSPLPRLPWLMMQLSATPADVHAGNDLDVNVGCVMGRTDVTRDDATSFWCADAVHTASLRDVTSVNATPT